MSNTENKPNTESDSDQHGGEAPHDIEGSPTCNIEGCDNETSIHHAVGKPDQYATVCSECSGPSHGMYASTARGRK